MDRHQGFPPPAAVTDANASAATAAAASGSSARGSIAERRAATCGFKAERITSPRFGTTASPLDSSAAHSPCITIPAGISPTALLDSPVLLPNSQPSPTTGSFPSTLLGYENGALNGDMNPVGSAESSFRLKHHGDQDSQQRFSTMDNQGYNVGSQALALAPMDFEFPAEFSKEATVNSCRGDLVNDTKPVNSMVLPNFIDAQICHSVASRNQSSVQRRPLNGRSDVIHHPVEDQKSTFTGTGGGGRTSEDGYSWRKYGQKQVKGSEYPRSYYKCTNPSCQVKKKIERSLDGQITEIIYKNAHNHPKPNQVRRGAQLESSPTADDNPDIDEGSGRNCVKIERGSLVVKNAELGKKDNNEPGTDWRAADGLERTSSASVMTELSDLLSPNQGKSVVTFESVETPELSSAVASHEEDDDDGITQGSISVGSYIDEEESDSKRRKIESCLGESNVSSRAVREPRVVVQIESEVDILDDGYRWRKYGQKVVKGNPNPRSYYKCTSLGCSVRKHVERASHNLKYVITTYEGKHNHEVPAARNSNSLSSNGSSLSQASGNTQPGLTLPRGGASVPKPETQMQDFVPGFDRRSLFNNSSDYLRGGFSGNFVSEMKLEPIYSMKFPAMHSSIPYGSYSFNSTRTPIHQPGSMGPLVPQFPLPLSSSLHTLGGVDLSNHVPPGMGQVAQPFIPGQQRIRPKQELKDDNFYDAGAASSIVNQLNASQPQLYQRIMGNFPS
ncbi:unnamed protein product [Linum trigynum]|uniref:WRKY domain-containing protein n=1 Tax=Linum trigynum TaxID=586398 RepID=A0AAV2EH80_9ROSI